MKKNYLVCLQPHPPEKQMASPQMLCIYEKDIYDAEDTAHAIVRKLTEKTRMMWSISGVEEV